MSVYTIILDTPNDAAWQAIRENWPGRNYVHNDRVAFVAPEDIVLTSDIAQKVGIYEGDAWGIVVEIEHYAGYADRALIEWLHKFS